MSASINPGMTSQQRKVQEILERAKQRAAMQKDPATAQPRAEEAMVHTPQASTTAMTSMGRPQMVGYDQLFSKSTKINDFSKLKPSTAKAPAKYEKLTVNLTELASGQPKMLRIVRKNRCAQCDGKKTQKEMDFTCQHCKGAGEIFQDHGALDFHVPFRRSTPCTFCDKTGIVIPEEYYCWCCLGQGLIDEPIAIEVPLQSLLSDPNSPIVVEGQGDDSLTTGFNRGDVEVSVKLLEHAHWMLLDQFLYCEKKVSALETLNGQTWKLTTLTGKILECRSFKPPKDNGLLINVEQKIIVKLLFVYPEEWPEIPCSLADVHDVDGVTIFDQPNLEQKNFVERKIGHRKLTHIPFEIS